jgi:hypothetical protein
MSFLPTVLKSTISGYCVMPLIIYHSREYGLPLGAEVITYFGGS